MEFIFQNWADLVLVFVLSLLFVVSWKRERRRSIAFTVITEQCLTYVLFMYLLFFPIGLKLALGTLYIGVYWFTKNLKDKDLSISAIAKIYLFVGVYHMLLAFEPFLIDLMFNSKGVLPYVDLAHHTINIISNLLIVGLVIFGGQTGERKYRKPYIHDHGERSFRFSDSRRAEYQNKRQARGKI